MSTTPVSYTHLDVYKRQILDSHFDHIRCRGLTPPLLDVHLGRRFVLVATEQLYLLDRLASQPHVRGTFPLQIPKAERRYRLDALLRAFDICLLDGSLEHGTQPVVGVWLAGILSAAGTDQSAADLRYLADQAR